jgi:hypothetical protein
MSLTAAELARFDRVFEQDEKSRLRTAYNERLAAALAAGSKTNDTAKADDSIARGWYADHYEEPAEVGIEISDDDRRFAYSAEGEFLAMAKERTGDTAADEQLKEWADAKKTLAEQTRLIAEKAKAAGLAHDVSSLRRAGRPRPDGFRVGILPEPKGICPHVGHEFRRARPAKWNPRACAVFAPEDFRA